MIKLNDKYYDKVVSGEKTQTIRLGRRDVELGENVLEFEGKPNIEIMVISVTYKWYGNISEREMRLDGFDSKRELMEELVSYYPDLRMTSEMTLIEFITFDEN